MTEWIRALTKEITSGDTIRLEGERGSRQVLVAYWPKNDARLILGFMVGQPPRREDTFCSGDEPVEIRARCEKHYMVGSRAPISRRCTRQPVEGSTFCKIHDPSTSPMARAMKKLDEREARSNTARDEAKVRAEIIGMGQPHYTHPARGLGEYDGGLQFTSEEAERLALLVSGLRGRLDTCRDTVSGGNAFWHLRELLAILEGGR